MKTSSFSKIVCGMLLCAAGAVSFGEVQASAVYYLSQNEKSKPSQYALKDNSLWKDSAGNAGPKSELDVNSTYVVNNNRYLRTFAFGNETLFKGKCLKIGEETQGRLLMYGGSAPLSFEESAEGLVLARGQLSSQQTSNEVHGAVMVMKNITNPPTISWAYNDSVLVFRGKLSSEDGAVLKVGVKDDAKGVNSTNLSLRIYSDCSDFSGSLGVESSVRFDDANNRFGRRIEFGNVKFSGQVHMKGIGSILTTVEPSDTVEIGNLYVEYELRIEAKRNGMESSLIKVANVHFPETQGKIEIKTLWDGINDIKTSRPLRFPVLEVPYSAEIDDSVFKLTSGDTVFAGASLKWVANADKTRKTLCVAYPARGAFCLSVR